MGRGKHLVRRWSVLRQGRSRGSARPRSRSEEALRATLREDPNDVQAFVELAEIVRRTAAEEHETEDADEHADPQRAADDAVWALSEELAQSPRAWYPLIEMGRLSIDQDHDSAMRRFSTAAQRDDTGQALAHGMRVLLDSGHPDEALSLGVGNWRAAEHELAAGESVVRAAIAAGRFSEARRFAAALADHPAGDRARLVVRRLEQEIAAAENPRTVDLRDPLARLRIFRRRG